MPMDSSCAVAVAVAAVAVLAAAAVAVAAVAVAAMGGFEEALEPFRAFLLLAPSLSPLHVKN